MVLDEPFVVFSSDHLAEELILLEAEDLSLSTKPKVNFILWHSFNINTKVSGLEVTKQNQTL